MKQIILTAIYLAIAMRINAQSNTVQIEYFLDTDNGFGMNTVMNITSPDIDVIETILADIPSSTTLGYHKLYIRTKDENGNWSHTFRRQVQVFAPVVEKNIVMGEYFIDQDPMFGVATTFDINPQEGDIEQQFAAQILETVSLGYHKLYGRVQDSYGNWSHTFRKNIEVYLNPDSNLVEIEYFTGDDLEFGNNSIITIDVPATDGTWSFDVLSYPSGVYEDINEMDTLFVRVKDSNGKWSITTTLDEINSGLGIENNLYKTVSVNPNPFTNTINLEVSKNIVFSNIAVFDITGREVYTSTEDLRTINLQNLEAGTYILSLASQNEKATYKIVKQ
ncbi:T9SS type A sorting domain-containing protein [Winogradskyella schleiferi]|uniref:T9SS type A sorting domain-containing protein n=1 Tax=Winogradskyella schleiferi TaxID=2686078 RepID=UPI0015BE3B56|nr:T9SS type A sorting domain-containing protein [Winogradskyella schleiferi]